MTWSVVSKPEATRQAEEIEAWWKEHRAAAPGLFQAEVSEAIVFLENAPELGVEVPSERLPTLRRIQLRRTKVHIYFVTDASASEVTILAFWGAQRGSPPDLG